MLSIVDQLTAARQYQYELSLKPPEDRLARRTWIDKAIDEFIATVPFNERFTASTLAAKLHICHTSISCRLQVLASTGKLNKDSYWHGAREFVRYTRAA